VALLLLFEVHLQNSERNESYYFITIIDYAFTCTEHIASFP